MAYNNPERIMRATLGSALKHLWVPDARRITIFSSTQADTVIDEVGGATLSRVNGTTTWSANGGPAARACVVLDSTDAAMNTNGPSVAAGNRTAVYAVVKQPGGATDRFQFVARVNDVGSYDAARVIIGQNNGKFRGLLAFTGGTQDINTTAAVDTDWHLVALRPLSTGASYRIDGIEASPTFTGTDTLGGIQSVQFGQVFGNAGGSIAMALMYDTTAIDNTLADQVIRQYVGRHFRIAP